MVKLNKDFFAGTVVGFGAGIFGREIYSSAGGFKQLGRAVIRTAMVSYDKALEGVSYLKETIEDLTAEAKAEVVARKSAAEAGAPAEGSDDAAAPAHQSNEMKEGHLKGDLRPPRPPLKEAM